MHPSIFIANEENPGTRSVESLRRATQSGIGKSLMTEIKSACEMDIVEQPIVPESMFEGRNPEQAAWANRDYVVCDEARKRIKRAAFCALVTEDRRYVDQSLRQVEVLFDERMWPVWRDKAVAHTKFPADLRTGMFARELGLAYDWLHPFLTEPERSDFIAGLDRCGIAPFFESVQMGPHWINRLNNWTTCVVGGLGIAGMAIGGDHPRGRELVDFSLPIMKLYLETALGPEGDFNESVGYANANVLIITYIAALRSFTRGEIDLTTDRLVNGLTWLLYMTIPPGSIIPFGDAHIHAAPDTNAYAEVAEATQNAVFQWHHLEHRDRSKRRDRVFELLYYDPELEPRAPDLPLGRVFRSFGACVTSRSSWDPHSVDSVVCGKAGIENHHQHHDAGQVTIGGYGERLIVDLGSPSEYPADFFGPDRYMYYNASSLGHNLVSIDKEEMTDLSGRYLASDFGIYGGYWRIDLTDCYREAIAVTRTVVHHLPSVVAVYDEVEVVAGCEVELRWHTATKPTLGEEGAFSVSNGDAAALCLVSNLGGSGFEMDIGNHEYLSPYDTGRSGTPLEQCREPFVSIRVTGAVRLLSLFAIHKRSSIVVPWRSDVGAFTVIVDGSPYTVSVTNDLIRVGDGSTLSNAENGLQANQVVAPLKE